MRRTQIFLPENMHATLKAEAYEQRITFSEYIRRILDEFLQKHQREYTEKGIRTLMKMTEE